MEKKNQQKAYAFSQLQWFAEDVVEFVKQGHGSEARKSWHEVIGAATMYSVMTDDNPDPIQKYAYPTLRAAANKYGVDMDFVLACLSE